MRDNRKPPIAKGSTSNGGNNKPQQRNNHQDGQKSKFTNNKFDKKPFNNNNNSNGRNNFNNNKSEPKSYSTAKSNYFNKQQQQQPQQTNQKNITVKEEVKEEENEEPTILFPTGTSIHQNNPTIIHAESLYKQQCDEYLQEFKRSANRDELWNEKIQYTGTLKDKVSAITLLIKKAPIYRLSSLDLLLNFASKKSERDRELAIQSLKDLFINSLLPNNKLKRFVDRLPINNDTKKEELVQWYFEDLLKIRYQIFIGILEKLAKDQNARIRMIATATIQYLLIKKPEQEDVLLSLLVNKLGDSDGSNSSKAVKLLVKVLESHPGMRPVIIREIESFLYRSNNTTKAQYNAIFFLTTLQMSEKTTSQEEASKFINIYFSFFNQLMKKSNDKDKQFKGTSALPILLSGIKNAYKISKEQTKIDNEQIDKIFKAMKQHPINVCIKALCLLFEISKHSPELTERFYRSLYQTLIRCGEDLSVYDQTPLLNLIFRVLKTDNNQSRRKAMIKRLFQFSFQQKSSFAASCHILLSKFLELKPEYVDLFAPQKPATTKPYDPMYYDPSTCGAENSNLWEITFYQHHYHPTIAKLGNDLVQDHKVKFSGNPAALLTLHAFLDKFVLSKAFKNVKNSELNVKKSKIAAKYLDGEEDEDEFDITSDEEEEEAPREAESDEKYLEAYHKIKSQTEGLEKKSSSSKRSGIVQSEEEIDMALDFGDEEVDEDDDEEQEGVFKGDEDDAELPDFDDEDDEEFDEETFGKKKQKSKVFSDSFVDADEFANMLESSGRSQGPGKDKFSKPKGGSKPRSGSKPNFKNSKPKGGSSSTLKRKRK
eukprot:gene2932-3655_t